ncbi:hypothetical protein [Pseudonocardia alni]|uniref:hypothetical protein n=1 Tax=Pseudonocardia alni TaxID=33907 RepID=UPI00280BA253|nr:hypothetical protein [Pseudonocardia alni]
MSDTGTNESTDGGAWGATLRFLERIIFAPGMAAVCKLLLILAVVFALLITANWAGVPMPWGTVGPASVVARSAAR